MSDGKRLDELGALFESLYTRDGAYLLSSPLELGRKLKHLRGCTPAHVLTKITRISKKCLFKVENGNGNIQKFRKLANAAGYELHFVLKRKSDERNTADPGDA